MHSYTSKRVKFHSQKYKSSVNEEQKEDSAPCENRTHAFPVQRSASASLAAGLWPTYSACVCKTSSEERANHCTKGAEVVFMIDLVEYVACWWK